MSHTGPRLVRFVGVGTAFLLVGIVALLIDTLTAIPRGRALAELRRGVSIAHVTFRTEWRLATRRRAVSRRYNDQ